MLSTLHMFKGGLVEVPILTPCSCIVSQFCFFSWFDRASLNFEQTATNFSSCPTLYNALPELALSAIKRFYGKLKKNIDLN